MSGVNRCPKCGGVMEAGFIHAPRGILWDPEPHKWSVWGLERLLGSGVVVTIPVTEAYRCTKCRLVIFDY
jgi:hypothetical protein